MRSLRPDSYKSLLSENEFEVLNTWALTSQELRVLVCLFVLCFISCLNEIVGSRYEMIFEIHNALRPYILIISSSTRTRRAEVGENEREKCFLALPLLDCFWSSPKAERRPSFTAVKRTEQRHFRFLKALKFESTIFLKERRFFKHKWKYLKQKLSNIYT